MSDEKRAQYMAQAAERTERAIEADEYARARWLRWQPVRRLFQSGEVHIEFAYDGRCLSVAQFKAHVMALPARRIDKVVVHHTYSPNLALWKKYGGAYWLKNMEAYYRARLGWAKGPPGYIDDEGIWMFWTMAEDGIHAGRVGNLNSWGFEIVGDFQSAVPSAAVLDNATWAFAIMLKKAGLGIAGLKGHREYLATACPGNALWAKWSWFQGLVAEKLKALEEPPPPPPPPEPTEMEKLQAKVAALSGAVARLDAGLEQEVRDRKADDATYLQVLQSLGQGQIDHEKRIAALEAMNGDGK